MKKKFLSLTAALTMGMVLAGCSVPGFGSGVSSARDVVEKYAAIMEESQNYHADMTMEFEIAAKTQGMSIELPVSMSLSADVLDGNMHGDMELSMSLWGEEMEQSTEVYVESGRHSSTTYSYDPDYDSWTVSEDEDNTGMALSFSKLDLSGFDDAVMEHDKKSGTYIITQSFKDFADTNEMYGMLEESYGSMAESMSIDPDDILDGWEDAEVVYVFDKDFYLLSVTVDGCEYSGKVEEDGIELDVCVDLGLTFEFSDYGKIKDSDVEVPEKVKDSAVPSITTDLGDENVNVDVNIGGDDTEDVSNENEWNMSAEPENPGIPVVPEEPIDPIFSVDPIANDFLGSYNGIALTCSGDSWNDTFGADGWVFNNDDGEYGFMTAVNEKYQDADLHVYNYNMDKATRNDIIENGVYGYSIDCSWSAASPNMTWGGLTFGATAEDVQSVYGEPDFMYTGSSYTSYEYEITDNIDIEFYIYETGLRQVEVKFYGGL